MLYERRIVSFVLRFKSKLECKVCHGKFNVTCFGKTWKIVGGKRKQCFRMICLPCEKGHVVLKRDNRKKVVMQEYGNSKCQCCGETYIEFLTIDHIGGQKTKIKLGHSKKATKNNRKISGGLLYYSLIRDGFPHKDKLRVLCCNCNQATSNNRICPHERSV